MRSIRLLGVLSAAAVIAGLALALPPALSAGQRAEVAGLVLETLAPDELDDILAEMGKRAGVDVAAVRPGSPGAIAGFREGDILFSVGGTLVSSAAQAAALIRGASGDLVCTVYSANLSTFQMEVKSLRLRLGGASASAAVTSGTANAGSAAIKGTQPKPAAAAKAAPGPPEGGRNLAGGGVPDGLDPVQAYFNIMDFACSQAWGRAVITSPADRQRAAAALQRGWNQMDAATRAQIAALPQSWVELQKAWAVMSEADKVKKRAEWRDQILLPTNAFAPPSRVQRFAAEGNLVGFEYPASWTGGWQVLDGTPLLFVGPGGQEATWDKVLDTRSSPPGALFALVTITEEMRQLSYVQAARYLNSMLMPGAEASFKEVMITPIGQAGAIITMRGRFPGEGQERFYWIGVTAFGDGQVFAGRMGGPIAKALELLPGFHHMLATLQLNPPRAASGGGGASGAWEAAWSRVSTASVKYIWANK